MERGTASLSPAKKLLIQWRALWAMAYAFGKSMTLAQYRDPRLASEKAEMLEVWTRFAIFTLLGQIAALESNSKDDAKGIAHLRAIVGALAMLCALAAKIKRECAGRMTASMLYLDEQTLPQKSKQNRNSALTDAPAYLDSS